MSHYFVRCRALFVVAFLAFSNLSQAKITEIARYDLSEGDLKLKATIKPDFSFDSKFVVASYANDQGGFSQILHAETGKWQRKLTKDYDALHLFANNLFALEGGRLSLLALTSEITKTFGEKKGLAILDNPIIWSLPSLAGDQLVHILSEGEILLWQQKRSSPLSLTQVKTPTAAFFSGEYLITLNQAHTAQVWQIKDGTFSQIKSYSLNQPNDRAQKWPQAPIFSKDGRYVLAVLRSGRSHLLVAKTGEKLPLAAQGIRRAVFSDDGEKLFTISQSGVGSIWSTKSGQLISTAGDEIDATFSLSPDVLRFSSDANNVLVVARADGGRLWESIPNRSWSFCPEGSLIAAQFSLDGKKIFTIEEQGVVQVWQIDDLKETSIDDDIASFLKD